MSTRSRIGIEREDGTVVSVYCHWDGGPKHNGRILKEHYRSRERVEELISLGDLSYLQPELSTTAPHSFAHPQPGVTVAYHRDRGEEFCQRTDSSRAEWEQSDLQSYGYLFTKEGEWITYHR